MGFTQSGDGFVAEPVELDGSAHATLGAPGPTPGTLIMTTQGQLEPERLWLVGPAPDEKRLFDEAHALFDACGLDVTQCDEKLYEELRALSGRRSRAGAFRSPQPTREGGVLARRGLIEEHYG